MSAHDWSGEYPALVRIIRDRLGGKGTCSEVIDGYELLLSSAWRFTALLLGDEGTRAVAARSIQLAAPEAPLLQWVHVSDGAIDLRELRVHIPVSCSPLELLEDFLRLSVMIFRTLSNLSGDAVTGPLLSHLDEKLRTTDYAD